MKVKMRLVQSSWTDQQVYSPAFHKAGIARVGVIAKNITERKKADVATEGLRGSTKHYADQLNDILESMDQCFFACDPQWNFTFCNQKAAELFGCRKEGLIGQSIWRIFGCAEETLLNRSLKMAMAEKRTISVEDYFDLAKSWFEISINPGKEGLSVYFKNITDRKKREEDLRISNERYQFVSRATSDVVWDFDLVKTKLHVHPSFTEAFGHDVSGIATVEHMWMENLHPEDKDRVLDRHQAVLDDAGELQWEDDYRFRRADGSFAYVKDRAIIIRNSEGVAIRMIGSIRDVTREREAELALQRNEKKFRTMVQSGKDLIALFDANFQLTYVSPNHKDVMGLGYHQHESFDTFEPVHPDDQAMLQEAWAPILFQKTVQLPLYRYRSASGEYRWFQTILRNHLDEPDLQSIIANTRDITESKEAQDEINLLSHVAQESMDSVCILGEDGKLKWVNKVFTQRKGVSAAELIGKDPMEIIRVENIADRQLLREHFRNRTVFQAEMSARSKDGQLRWLEVKGHPVYDDKGAFLYYFCMQTEITERKLKEEAVKASEEKYKLLFDQCSIPKYVFRRDDLQFQDVNQAALQLYGYSRTEFLSMKLTDIRPEEDIEQLIQVLDEYHSGKGRTFEGIMRHRKKDGTLMSVEINSNPFRLPEGMHYMVVANDITEKVRLQAQVLEEKIAAQQEKAKAIIQTQEKERSEIGKELHDNVNQILTTAKLYVQNVQYYPEQSAAFLARSAELIEKSINEIRGLSRALVTPVIHDHDFNDTLLELIASYTELNTFAIRCELDFDENRVDKGVLLTIYRILQEQFNNTIKYAKATEVTISLKDKGETLAFVYQDNGVGFDPAERKPGLGLNNIRNRTEVYRGTLNIDSAAGMGGRMEIRFPLNGGEV